MCQSSIDCSGYPSKAGRGLRVGHLADPNEPMLLGALGALEVGLRRRSVPLGGGGLAAAVASLAGGGEPGGP